jgi:L-gulonate 5-dehydrogenase
MQSLVTTAPRHMEVLQTAEPLGPASGEALIKIEAAGICGSDYHLYLGDHPYSRFPQVQGHEFCGTVLGFGADCERLIPVGSRVVVEPLIGCGHCYPCSLGRYNCCIDLNIIGVHSPGAFQELLCVSERLLNETGDLDRELAAFAEPMTIALQAVKRAGVNGGDSVLIIGAGPIGQALLLSAKAYGARVAVADLVQTRLERAAAVGADKVVDARGDWVSEIRRWFGGDGPTVVIDATGSPAAIRSAFDVVSAAGRIVIVGISDRDVAVPVITYSKKELAVFGSRNSVRMFPEALKLVRENQSKVRTIITHRIELKDASDVIELALAKPEVVEKAVILF